MPGAKQETAERRPSGGRSQRAALSRTGEAAREAAGACAPGQPQAAHRRDGTGAAVASVAAAARRAVVVAVKAGAVDYRRATVLPRLVPVGPAEIADETPEGGRRILALLARALRSERRRGRAGHWSYDLNRHIGLRQAMLAETARAGAARSRQSGSTGAGDAPS